MLFTKALRRELASTAGLVFVILFTIVLTTVLMRMLGRAANGKVDLSSVVPLLAFTSVNLMPRILIITLFVAVLSTLSRAHRDSEMIVWFASGQSQWAWIRPVLTFAAPIVFVIGLLSLVVGPWASKQLSENKKRFDQREDISQVTAGQFRESGSSNRVFFVEALNKDFTEVKNIFVLQNQNSRQTVVVAANGSIRDDGKDRFLILEKGRRYDQVLPSNELQMLQFESHGIRLEAKAVDLADSSSRIKPTLALINERTVPNLAELQLRLSLPISAVILCLLAIPLSYVNPRVGRSANIIAAILIFFVYNSLLTYVQARMSIGRLNLVVGSVVVHAIFIALTIGFFIKRSHLGGFTGFFKRVFTSRTTVVQVTNA